MLEIPGGMIDPSEETLVELVWPQGLPGRIRAGEVDHALVLTALYWLHLDESER